MVDVSLKKKEVLSFYLNCNAEKPSTPEETASNIRYLLRYLDFSSMLFILETTRLCNFACEYCYANVWKEKGNMDRRILDVFLEKNSAVLRELTKQKVRFSFEFHGGEPLLNPYLITYAIEKISSQFPTGFSIQTNGSLIPETLSKNTTIEEYLKSGKLKIGVSLDGLSPFENKARKYPSGKNTVEDTLHGIQYIEDNEIPYSIITVISKYNVSSVPKMYSDLKKFKNLRGWSVNIVKATSNSAEQDLQPEKSALKKSLTELSHKYINDIISGETSFHIRSIDTLLDAILTGTQKFRCLRRSCGAGISIFAIDADGDVYPCTGFIGDHRYKIGNVENDNLYDIVMHPISQLLNITGSPNSCEYASICNAGFCPAKDLPGKNTSIMNWHNLTRDLHDVYHAHIDFLLEELASLSDKELVQIKDFCTNR